MAPLPRETMESPLALTLVAGLVALGIAGVVVNAGFWFLLAYVFIWSATLVFIADPDQFLDRIEAWLELDFDAGHRERTAPPEFDPESEADQLLTLRERYAAGNLDDEEFERMLDVLLSTETPGDARDHRERSSRRERERLSETPAR